MKPSFVLLVAAVALTLCGCKKKPKEVSTAARAEAAQDAGEAEFAMSIRDYTRAEDLFAKAVVLDPTLPRYWKQLGAARLRLGNNKGARKAYEQSLDMVLDEYDRTKKESLTAAFGAIESYVLLRRPDEARKFLDQVVKDHPDNNEVKAFRENKMIDRMIAEEPFKSSIIP
ncbi:MAG TPA: tetratricopeptide repeat protein [Opitutaceae bacterium]|nr:tetratricopeptide repeat protein [Opitutaceae bacterium]